MARVRSYRHVVNGVLLVLLGAWGAVVPFVGPSFGYAYTPDTAWHFTLARLWLDILPGAAAVLGGVLVVVSARRLLAASGALLALLGGAWFAVGIAVGPALSRAGLTPGTPAGGASMRALEEIGFFTGLGLVIVLAAAMTLGRYLVAVQPAGPGASGAGADPAATSTDDAPAGPGHLSVCHEDEEGSP